MPPKKASAKSSKAAPKGPSLQNCAITFSANSLPSDAIGGKTYAKVKDEITQNGGSFVTKVAECTHLVVTQAQYEKAGSKVKDAKEKDGVKIVSFEWLQKAFEDNGPVNETVYGFEDADTAVSQPTNGLSDANPTTTDAKTDADDGTTSTQSQSKKRKRDEKDDKDNKDDKVGTDATKKASKSTNVTKNLTLNVPLDEGLPSSWASIYKVYIEDDSTIYDATLNQSNAGKNANKFYRLQLLRGTSQWHTWTRWGRVGEHGQTKMLDAYSLDAALADFKKKFKDKTGNSWEDRNGPMKANKYVFIERSYEDESDGEDEDQLPGAERRKKVKEESKDKEEEEVVRSKLPEPVQKLLKMIFNKEYFNNTFDAFDYDAEKMPLGKLSKSSLMRGYDVLKDLAALVGSPSADSNQVRDLSNQYLSLIPHVVSRSSRPPVLSSMDMIKKEIELLEALTDMQLANDLMKNAQKKKNQSAEEISLLDRQYAGLGMQAMDPVDPESSEFRGLADYLTRSVGHTHGTKYQVQDIFRIERNGEHARFDESKYAKVQNKNRRLLWHGSRATNFGGILSQGLRIAPPEAPVSGYMFGKGVYLADMSSKSANYCCAHSSGATGLLLLCEAELGEPPLKLTNADYNAGERAEKDNHLSTWGVGQTAPQAWKDAECIHPDLKGIRMPDVVSVNPGPTNEAGAYLMYNEYIVYDVAQIKLRYLFRVSM